MLGKEGTDTRTHNPVLLANHSEYVDTLLANNMSETETRTLTFPDIEASEWDLMMDLLEDPCCSNEATVEEAKSVVHFFDKYHFHNGKVLCDHILSKHIQKMVKKKDLNGAIDTIAFSEGIGLVSVAKAGVAFLLSVFDTTLRDNLTRSHVEKVVPLIYSNDSLREAIGEETIDKEWVLSPLFPLYAVQSFKLASISNTSSGYRLEMGSTQDSSSADTISQSVDEPARPTHPQKLAIKMFITGQKQAIKMVGPNASGAYHSSVSFDYGHNDHVSISLDKSTDRWVVHSTWRAHGYPAQVTSWTCQKTPGVPWPPEQGWVAHNYLARSKTMELTHH